MTAPGLCLWQWLWEELCPAEPSRPPKMRNKSSWTQSFVQVGKGMAIPSSGECPEPFFQTAFIGNVMCRCLQHTHIAHQSMSKAIVIQKQVLSIDNNWRNTEICHRSGSVSHADARWSFRRVSWDKEFITYALNLTIQFILTEPYKAKQSKLQRIQCIFQAWFLEPSVLELVHVCHLRYLVFQGELLAPFRACSHGTTVSKTTQSCPQQMTACHCLQACASTSPSLSPVDLCRGSKLQFVLLSLFRFTCSELLRAVSPRGTAHARRAVSLGGSVLHCLGIQLFLSSDLLDLIQFLAPLILENFVQCCY